MKKSLLKTAHFLNLLKQDYPEATFVVLLHSFCVALIPYLALVCSAFLINDLTVQNYHDTYITAGILIGGTLILQVITSVTEAKINVYKNTMESSISRMINDKAYVMEYDVYETKESMDRIRSVRNRSNATGSADMVIEYLDKLVTSIFKMILSFICVGSLLAELAGYVSFMSLSLWILIGLLILTVLTSYYLTRKYMQEFEKMQSGNVHINSALNYLFNTSISPESQPAIKNYGFQNIFTVLMERLTKNDLYEKFGRYKTRIMMVVITVANLFAAVTYIYVGRQSMDGFIPLGNVMMYAVAIQSIADGMKEVGTNWNELVFRLTYMDDLYQFIHEPAMHYDGTLPVEKRNDCDYEIEFKDVSFQYPGSDRKVLDHVSLKFNVGEKLAVVGKNGAGKTTMIKLLCRLYEPTEGEILLNGINIWKYSYQEYTEIFAPVFQDYSLFSLSLEDNIAFDKDADETRVTDSLNKVGLKERVEKLPEGIHTQLNHDNGEGVDLSGGEEQRAAIARVLYKDAPFIILDEPAASLDPIAEAEIYEKFDELVHGKTSIYISHRMSSCQFCDRIIVFKEGKIIETGTHDSLMKQNGEYAELFNTQAEYYQ